VDGKTRKKPLLLNKQEVVNLLRKEIAKAGSQSEWARRTGIHRTALSALLNGRKGLQPKILAALGLKKVVAYSRK